MKCAQCFGFGLGVGVVGGGYEDAVEMADERVNLEFSDGVGVGAAKVVTVFACEIDSAWSIDE